MSDLYSAICDDENEYQSLCEKYNVKKRHAKKRLANAAYGIDNSISLEELMDAIKKYTGDWKEHKLCLDLIAKYERGEKWKRA